MNTPAKPETPANLITPPMLGSDLSDLYICATEVFHVPDRFSSYFDRYFILHYTPEHLISIFNGGVIIKDAIQYYVTNHCIADIISWSNDPHVRLSFRKIADLNYGFVIIRRARLLDQNTRKPL